VTPKILARSVEGEVRDALRCLARAEQLLVSGAGPVPLLRSILAARAACLLALAATAPDTIDGVYARLREIATAHGAKMPADRS
jgi:hypothetical protein